MNAYQKIRQAMRRNEVEVLAYVRKNRPSTFDFWGHGPWNQALDRLVKGKMVIIVPTGHGGRGLRACFGARPVTPAVRRKS